MVNRIQEYIALCITYEVWDLLQVTRHSAHGQQPEQIKEWGKTLVKTHENFFNNCEGNLQGNHYACWFAKQKRYQRPLKHVVGRRP